MAEKIEGATQTCGVCGKMMVCRKKPKPDNPNYLQWQDEDSTAAHFKFLHGKVSCKYAEEKEDDTNSIQVKLGGNKEEPTPEELLAFCKKVLDGKVFNCDEIYHSYYEKAAIMGLKQAGIRKFMDDIEIQHPGRVAFIEQVLEESRQ